MGTKFETVYDRAIFKITDYTISQKDVPQDFTEAVLQKYLMSSIVEFQHQCEIDLTDYDLETESFNNDLSDEIIEILALGIAYHWLDARCKNSELLRNRIHNSDYTFYSPANLLEKIQSMRKTIRKEYLGAINTYSFRQIGIKDKKV